MGELDAREPDELLRRSHNPGDANARVELQTGGSGHTPLVLLTEFVLGVVVVGLELLAHE